MARYQLSNNSNPDFYLCAVNTPNLQKHPLALVPVFVALDTVNSCLKRSDPSLTPTSVKVHQKHITPASLKKLNQLIYIRPLEDCIIGRRRSIIERIIGGGEIEFDGTSKVKL